MTPNYCIFNKEEKLFWSNRYGWVGYSTCDVFSEEQTHTLHLPIGGKWHKTIAPLTYGQLDVIMDYK